MSKFDYYNWLINQISSYSYDIESYQQLLQRLYEVEFYAVLERDENRISDGLHLIREYEDWCTENDSLPNIESDHDYCSVLELLIALSIRIEYELMYNINYGDRVSEWFWTMLENLGLDQMYDDNYDQFTVDSILHVYINRLYEPSGKEGNIFYSNNRGTNLKDMEIWSQMNNYFDEFYL